MRNPVRLFSSSSLLFAALIGIGAAQAQTSTPETVTVTGSRIPVESNFSSPSPISVATATQIDETSAFNLEDVVTKLTGADFTSGISNNSNNGANGLSEVGLRNLGPTRTLVLIDGERLLPIFSTSISVPDLNSVPVTMVDHIEVLKDSASSVYGADAIGGVINIITKKDFEGFQIDSYDGASQHGGGDIYNVSGTLGVNFDRGNITLSALNENESPIDSKDRAWAQDPHIGQPGLEGGSTYRSQLNILQDATNGSTVWDGTETSIHNPALGSLPCLTFLPDDDRVKLNAGCPSVTPGATVAGGIGRTQFNMSGHYDVMPDVTFVVDGFFTRRNSEERLRPEPLLGASIASTNPITGASVFDGFYVPTSWPGFSDPLGTASIVPCPNLVGTPQAAAQNCIQANLTPDNFGPRDYKQVSDTYRVRVGLEGTVYDNYKWEVGYVQQRNDTVERTYNSGNWLHLAQATGQLPCVDVPGGCVYSPAWGYDIPAQPFNFFNGVNTLTSAQAAYLTYTMTDTNYSYENYIYANVSGPIFDLPAGTLQGALGFERRFEYAADSPDALVQEGYAANPSAATAGGYGVTSVYGELRIPVLKDVPFAQALVLTPSARFDHYSTFGDAKTWKIGGDWQIDDMFRVRATYATGFRAPSTAELYAGNAISYISVDGDPCDSRAAGYNGNSNAGLGSLAAGSPCYKQLSTLGLTPAQIAVYQSPENNLSSDQRGLIIGGNSQLKPELSHSWNAGAVITPTFSPGLSFSGDYYETTITNSILDGGVADNAGPDIVVLGCFVQNNPAYCSLITRNSSGIFQIGSTNTNFGINKVTGLDLELDYGTKADGVDLPFGIPGSINVDAQAEHEITNTTQNPDYSVNEFTG